MEPQIFFVEGNIGSGKSTFLKNIKQYFDDAQFLQEPVDVWKNTVDKDNNNILHHFYNDMQRFCYTFQSFAFISRIQQLDLIDNSKNIIFIERSVFCDKNVFASTCYDSNIMSDIEWNIYNTWFTWMEEKYKHIFSTANYIYLQCSPATSLSRIASRARDEESSISIDYLTTLHDKHDEWLSNELSTIIIDAEQNLLDDNILKNVANTISHHLHK